MAFLDSDVVIHDMVATMAMEIGSQQNLQFRLVSHSLRGISASDSMIQLFRLASSIEEGKALFFSMEEAVLVLCL